MRPGELQHNNITSYFGSSITQSTVDEGLLDHIQEQVVK